MELNYGSLVIHAPFKANKLTFLGWVVNITIYIYKLRKFCIKKLEMVLWYTETGDTVITRYKFPKEKLLFDNLTAGSGE